MSDFIDEENLEYVCYVGACDFAFYDFLNDIESSFIYDKCKTDCIYAAKFYSSIASTNIFRLSDQENFINAGMTARIAAEFMSLMLHGTKFYYINWFLFQPSNIIDEEVRVDLQLVGWSCSEGSEIDYDEIEDD